MSKKVIYIIVGLILIILIVVVAKQHGQKPAMVAGNPTAGQQAQSKNVPQAPVSITQVAKNQAPQGFPSGIPIEQGATIVDNFSGTVGTEAQSTREFISAKSADANFTLYENWLKGNGWTITNSLNQPTQKVIYAKQGSNNLNIRIYTASDGKIHVAINNFVSTK